LKRLCQDVQEHLSVVNQVCLSGSLPPNSSAEDLRGLLNILIDSGKQVWVDTSGMALKLALDYPDLCIKVNSNEIGEMLGLEINETTSPERALLMLRERRRTTSVITLGSAGALLATKDGKWRAQGPDVEVISTVGSGDAFLGGLVSALDADKDWPEALRDAVAAGTANTLSAGAGQFGLEMFQGIRKQIEICSW
jgi:tagatose 6-phosphate kinase